jgi:hypothetical protein
VVLIVHCEDGSPGEIESAAFGCRHILFDLLQEKLFADTFAVRFV